MNTSEAFHKATLFLESSLGVLEQSQMQAVTSLGADIRYQLGWAQIFTEAAILNYKTITSLFNSNVKEHAEETQSLERLLRGTRNIVRGSLIGELSENYPIPASLLAIAWDLVELFYKKATTEPSPINEKREVYCIEIDEEDPAGENAYMFAQGFLFNIKRITFLVSSLFVGIGVGYIISSDKAALAKTQIQQSLTMAQALAPHANSMAKPDFLKHVSNSYHLDGSRVITIKPYDPSKRTL